MSQIKNEQTARIGLSGLFNSQPLPETTAPTEGLQKLEDTPKTKEEIIDSFSDETREALQKELQRRQYLKAGRPPKGTGKKSDLSVPMTFRITPGKQEELRKVSLQEGLFIGEVMERAIDFYLALNSLETLTKGGEQLVKVSKGEDGSLSISLSPEQKPKK